jgi:hypothetical protein
MTNFQEMMAPVTKVLHVFAFAGVFLLIGLGMVAFQLLKLLIHNDDLEQSRAVNWQVIKAEVRQNLPKKKTTSG